jgi:hypothetical protein
MPTNRSVHDPNPKPDSGSVRVALALALGAAAGYWLVWALLGGSDGCGPVGHSSAGRILSASPFVLPLAAVVIFLAVGWVRCWRVSTLVWSAITIIVIGGLLEILVLLHQIGIHQCTQ